MNEFGVTRWATRVLRNKFKRQETKGGAAVAEGNEPLKNAARTRVCPLEHLGERLQQRLGVHDAPT